MSVQPVLDARESETRIGADGDGTDADPSRHVRTQLLRRIAHDIASPTGVTLTVLDELATSDSPRPELVGMARRSLRRLMRLSEQLALVSELETSGLQLECSTADLRALTRQALDDALAVDGRKDVVAACDLSAQPVHLLGDGRLLLVVIREVIGNALRLASSRVEVSLKAQDGVASLRVDDDGPGFSKEALAVFGKRFVRGAARGLGLSLSMATEILREHRGVIETKPSRLPPGRRGYGGAAVVVTLPLR